MSLRLVSARLGVHAHMLFIAIEVEPLVSPFSSHLTHHPFYLC